MLPAELGHTGDEAGVIVGEAGLALTTTSALLVAGQPEPFVTVSVSVVVPGTPAVHVTVCEVCPFVIVPLVIDHEYVVAPAGPMAVLPVELAQTPLAEGVIVGDDGLGLIVTFVLFEAEQPAAFVTTRVRPTVPEAPAV